MPPRILTALLVALLTWGAMPPASAQAAADTISEIEIIGLNRMSRVALLHVLDIDPGDPYDPVKIRRNFRALWKIGVFEDIVINAEDAPDGGKAIVIRLVERPELASVDYEDTSVISRTEIEDALTQRSIELKAGQPLDMGKIAEVESILRDVLAQKGHLAGRVEADVRKQTETSRSVLFRISPGGKTRIRKIDFVGNEIYKDGKLISSLELTQPRRWYWPWSRKNLYHEVKWDQDVANVRKLYLNQGYLDVDIRPPVVEVRDSDGELIEEQEQVPLRLLEEELEPMPEPPVLDSSMSQKERDKAIDAYDRAKEKAERKRRKQQRKADKEISKRWVYLTVRVNEGEQYSLGDVSFEGNEVFESNALRRSILMLEGSTLNSGLLDLGVDQITRRYENEGHLYANVVRNLERREGELIADVKIVVDEDDPYDIERINFSGNSSTLDNVLRREMLVNEGDRFSRDGVDVSRAKLNQLGYWAVPGEPVIEPMDQTQAVRVTVAGEEQGRNEIQVGGGYSGLDGAFFNGVYSTRNFLGRGQVLSTAIQIGGISNRYQISFQEPWLFNRPILLGASIFRRDFDFGNSLETTSDGLGLVIGRRLGRFSRFNVGYNWESLTSTSVVQVGGVNQNVNSDIQISSITPVFNFSTINNPYRPSRGVQVSLSTQIAGGAIGGDTAFVKPILRFTGYRRLFRRAFLGMHTQLGYVSAWDDGSIDNSAINGVPRAQRFWLGGDVLGPRVFDVRTIVPLRFATLDNGGFATITGDPTFLSLADPNSLDGAVISDGFGTPILVEVGGDRYFLYQNELVFPVNEQIDMVGFFDVGDVFFEDQSLNFDTTRISAGLELRFNLPIFPVPLRLIWGQAIRKLDTDRTSSFSFSVGRSF